ncbi:MAG TPA: DUF72 domain-containing protein [Symbiobacteriaceae bacterium]|nr:DUF72 domain-containing protein [Symbiobacteriaceae bacterium]
MGLIRAGTCAWADHEEYYPKGLPPGERLSYYARHFPIVEVDSSFYHLQPPKFYAGWAARTPPGFVFNVKAYGAMTRHHREPRPGEEDAGEVIRRFDASVQPLREAGKLKALHFQFPPWFTRSAENMEWIHFCREFFKNDIVAVEFRHQSWFLGAAREATLQLLTRLNAVNVICDEPQVGSGTVPAVVAVTDPRLAIVRFHGRNAKTWYIKAETTAQRFDYLYSREELQGWVGPVQELAAEADEVHLLMNNNRANYAVRNALDIMSLLGLPVPELDERGVPTPPRQAGGKPEQLKLF